MIKGKSGDHSLILTRWNILSNLFGNVCCLSGVAISTAPHVSATPRPAVALKRAARTERAETVSYWFCLKIIMSFYISKVSHRSNFLYNRYWDTSTISYAIV